MRKPIHFQCPYCGMLQTETADDDIIICSGCDQLIEPRIACLNLDMRNPDKNDTDPQRPGMTDNPRHTVDEINRLLTDAGKENRRAAAREEIERAVPGNIPNNPHLNHINQE